MILTIALTATLFTIALIIARHVSYNVQHGLICTPLTPRVTRAAAPIVCGLRKGPAISFADGHYLAARAARNILSLEDFYLIAFDKAPSPTPASFAALTPKQVATMRGKIHKEWNHCNAIRAKHYAIAHAL